MIRSLALRVMIFVACTVSSSITFSTPTYKSSVFSRKVTRSTLGNGVTIAGFDFAGRIFAYKSYLLRKVTFNERNPLPIGVVIGAFKSTLFLSKEAYASSGISFPFRSYSIAPTSKHSNVTFAFADFKISNTASQISGPIPSPRNTVTVFINDPPSSHSLVALRHIWLPDVRCAHHTAYFQYCAPTTQPFWQAQTAE
ncbi:unknown [Amedibacillus dolichus CAG:375]|uniref:Uncharacterized protein n=1 Tax=Amedibacillus dolichus CAG:375 TaxID=1263076 RepID=R7G5B1_9FIRM|nr:unknown [Amedibacillus dolichus CAG:375]